MAQAIELDAVRNAVDAFPVRAARRTGLAPTKPPLRLSPQRVRYQNPQDLLKPAIQWLRVGLAHSSTAQP
eukprot:1011987-Pleurochrysis_carterae.AAC.1